MNKNKLGVAIIGCGIISSSHIKAYESFNEKCEIKAVCDVIPEKADKLAGSINENVMAYTDYRELLLREDIDVVSICTPPFAHKEAVIEAFKAGKHVLCEKPLAASLEECDEMIATAKKYNKKLTVSLQYRYRKDFNQAKHLLDCGILDPVTFGQLNALYWRGDKYYDVDWRGKWATESGGVTINHAIHLMDIFVWLMGDVESVYAEIDSISHDIEVEDLSMAILKFRNGSVGQVNGTVSSAINDVSMNISGKNKGFSLPLQFHALKENDGGFPVLDYDGIKELEVLASEVQDGTIDHTGPVNDLFMAIEEDREPLVNGVEGRKIIEVITAIYKSGTTGEKVSFPLSKSDPWYTTEGLQRLVKKGKRINVQ